MKRLTALISGNVQQVGYRAKVIDIARAFGLKGMVENLKDGRVLIIADGEDKKLDWFEDAINIKNTLIQVTSIEKEYSTTDGKFDDFGKLVFKGETDSRLDRGVEVMKEMLSGIKDINKTLIDINSNLGGKMDQMLEKQDRMLEKQDSMLEKQDSMLEKQDRMLEKQDSMLEKQDKMLEKQDDLIVEVKDVGLKIEKVLDKDIVELKSDMFEIKAALKAKGII